MTGARRATLLLAAAVVCATAGSGVLGHGVTYAAFSDTAPVSGNQASAGTVIVESHGEAAPALRYDGLQPGVVDTDDLRLSYRGSIAADLSLDVDAGADGAGELCVPDAQDRWVARDGGSLQIAVPGSDWVDYCSLLGQDGGLPLATDVRAGQSLDLGIRLRLVSSSDLRYSELDGTDQVVVRARQSGGSRTFTDFVAGTIEIATGTVETLPAQCVQAGLTGFDASSTVVGTAGDDVLDVGRRPAQGRGYLVLGLGGDDVITGSNQGDCLVGGSGDDHLVGGNGKDVLLGDGGDDVLGATPTAVGYDGGNGKDQLFGGTGDDVLYGGNGKDDLDGGSQVLADVCLDTVAHGGAAVVDCESVGVGRGLTAAPQATSPFAATKPDAVRSGSSATQPPAQAPTASDVPAPTRSASAATQPPTPAPTSAPTAAATSTPTPSATATPTPTADPTSEPGPSSTSPGAALL